MDFDVEEFADVEFIVKDTNEQMELENKLVSDLMKSLEYEHQQEKDEELSEDGKKDARNFPGDEQMSLTMSDSSKSHDRDQDEMEYREMPLIVIETENEWRRRECDEKRRGKSDDIASPEETTPKYNSKEEDFEFEINMEHFQKELSDIVKEDVSAQTEKDVFSSILDELESHIENEALESCSEDKTDTKEREFETILRVSEKGQCCRTTSEPEITCDQRYLPEVPSNMSDKAQACALNSQPVRTDMDHFVTDIPVLIASEKRSELLDNVEGQSRKSTPDTPSNSEPRGLELFTNNDSSTPEDLVNYTTQLSNKPQCFEETNNTVLEIQGQNAEISLADIPELKNADDVMPCESLEGGSIDTLPCPPECSIKKTKIPFRDEVMDSLEGGFIDELPWPPRCNIEKTTISFQEDVMDNVDQLTGKLRAIMSPNDVDNEIGVDLRDGPCGGSLEKRFKSPVNISSEGDDRTRCDLLDEHSMLAAGVDDDEWRQTMSRRGELHENRIFTTREKTTEMEGIRVSKHNEIEWKGKMEMGKLNSELEEKNLISFDDDDVIAQQLPLATGLNSATVSELEQEDQKMKQFDLLTDVRHIEKINGADVQNNKYCTNLKSAKEILFDENGSGEELKENEMGKEKIENEREIKREKSYGKELASFPLIGTLVEISPQCSDDQLSPETAGIPLGTLENTSVMIDSCKDQILFDTPACTDMHSSERERADIISKINDAEDGKQTKDRLGISMEKSESKDWNEEVLSCEELAKNSCGFDGLETDAGNDSKTQSQEFQTLDKVNCYEQDEEATGTKDVICGSTKRQREHDSDIEVGLKKLKISGTMKEEYSTDEQESNEDTRDSQNRSLKYKKEEETQGIETVMCDNNVHVKEKECPCNIEENKMTPETFSTQNCVFTSQDRDSQQEQEKGNGLVNLDNNCHLECRGETSECALETETPTMTAKHEAVQAAKHKPMKQETLKEMSLNDALVACNIKNNENVEGQNPLPCCYGDATSVENKDKENNEERESGKMLFEDNEPEDKSCGEVEQDVMSFQDEIEKFGSQTRADCRLVGERSSVEALSEHLNELLIDEEDKQTDIEKNSSNELEHLLQITTDSRRHAGVTQDGVTRVTQGSGQESQIHPGREDDESVTQGETDLKRDLAVNVTQDTGQKEQIHSEDQITEPKKGDVTQGEKSVTNDLDKDVTKQKEQTYPVSLEKEQKLEGETQGEETRVMPEVKYVDQESGKETMQKIPKEKKMDKDKETEESVTKYVKQGETQEALHVETASNQIVTQVEQSLTHEVTRDITSYKNVAQEREKRIGAGVAEELKEFTLAEKQDVSREGKEIEVEEVEQNKSEKRNLESTQNLIHKENGEVTLEEVTQEYEDVAKDVTEGLKIEEEVTQRDKRVTQLDEKEKVKDGIQDVIVDVSVTKQLRREVTQSEMKGGVTQEAQKNAKEEVDAMITQLQLEKDRKQEEGKEEQEEAKAREKFDDKTMEAKREQERESDNENEKLLKRKNDLGDQFSKDKQQETQLKDLEKKTQELEINSQENPIFGAEAKMKILKKEEVIHQIDGKSYEAGRNGGESETASSQEKEKDEDKENRIRSFEMLVHLETIIKELEVYRSEQKRLRNSFKTCMNEIMNNLSSMNKAVQLMETRLNQKIKDAHEELKKCCGNLEGNRATILSMDTLLRSYSVTQDQFGDLRQRVKDLEIICTALNATEMKNEISNQVSAEIDAMDRRVRFTENDVSDLKLRVTELEEECSSLRKLSPVDEQVELQVGKRELKFGRGFTRRENSFEKARENLNEQVSLERSSPVVGPGQRYYGLYSEEV